MQVQCPGCGKVVDFADAQPGQVVSCPQCAGQMQIPHEDIVVAQEPEVAAERRCPFCAEVIRQEAIKCQHCQQFLDGRQQRQERDGPDWERRSEMGSVAAVIGTVKGVLFSPGRTFERARIDDAGSALRFCLTTSFFGVGGAVLWQVLPGALGRATGGADLVGTFMGALIGLCISVIIFVPIALVILTAVVHVGLMVLGGAKAPYGTTFRALAYSYGAAYLFLAVPVCGSLIAAIWAIVASVFALAKMHGVPYWKAVLAALLPFAVLFLLGAAIGVMKATGRYG